MPITTDDGQQLSPADLLELSDLLQPPGLPGINDHIDNDTINPEQLRSGLAQPIPVGDLDFWRKLEATTPRGSAVTSPADRDD